MAGVIGDKRDLELNALLEITQAINNNLSEGDLYRIYKFTLLADLKVKSLAMFVEDDAWKCEVDFGTSVDWSIVSLPVKHMMYKDIVSLDEG
ncbi:MAG: hypothetical protein AAFN93_27555, partial [Bacteroidota bacterium]